jgi:hypothetical protein
VDVLAAAIWAVDERRLMKCERCRTRDIPKPPKGPHGRRRYCLVCSPVRGKAKPVVDVPDDPADVPPPPPVDDETLRNAVRKELGDRAGTVDGVLAMKMAKLIDEAPPTASALTTLAKQMRAHITAATAGRAAEPDGVSGVEDEFEARQARRAARSA